MLKKACSENAVMCEMFFKVNPSHKTHSVLVYLSVIERPDLLVVWERAKRVPANKWRSLNSFRTFPHVWSGAWATRVGFSRKILESSKVL